MQIPMLDTTLLLLVLTVIINTLFHRLKLPSLLGYITIGILVGPFALNSINDVKTTQDIANFGIVFLMFTIGLEFSIQRLLKIKHIVFLFGSLQVGATLLITTVVGLSIGMTSTESLIIAIVVSMSSTAIVLKQLTDQTELHTPHGQNALGVLLFQDLSVIPFLILIPSLTPHNTHQLGVDLIWALISGIMAAVSILLVGRFILRPLLTFITKVESLELFTLTALLVTLGAAWLTNTLGLSLALGAFVAGIMLGETEFRHLIENDIRPFRDVLVGLFFISIGMLVNIPVLLAAWQWLLLLLAALIIFKFGIITLLARLFTKSWSDALRTGVILAQGGEFGIALLSVISNEQLLPNDYAQVVLGAILVSMAIAPLFIKANGRISRLVSV